MDSLFREYASPFSICDLMISEGKFDQFVTFFRDKNEERKRWDFYVNKVPAWNEMTWEEFNESFRSEPVAPAQQNPEKIAETINTSREILSSYHKEDDG